MSTIDRRGFVAGVSGLLALGIQPGRVAAQTPASGPTPGADFPRQRADLVREVVGASHRDEARVRELVGAHPALANAWWDWGFGDWESPLGAAAHTGRRAIAEFLITSGARVDIFAAAMLGWVDAVKQLVEASPGVQKTPGPHGLTLLHHARQGGEANPVIEYLTIVGGADDGPAIAPLAPERKGDYAGQYAFGAAAEERFAIRLEKDRLEFVKGASRIRIHHLGGHEFFPSGAPAVRLRFTMAGERAGSVTVIDHEPLLTASRIGE